MMDSSIPFFFNSAETMVALMNCGLAPRMVAIINAGSRHWIPRRHKAHNEKKKYKNHFFDIAVFFVSWRDTTIIITN
jgi:hypothetical protein